MSASVSAEGGYSLALAARHLVAGPLGPREALRDAWAAGIGERGRLALFFSASLLVLGTDPQFQASLHGYFGTVRSSAPAEGAIAIGILATLLGLLIGSVYVSEGLALYGAARIAARGHLTFARARTIVALGSWITVLPLSVSLLVARQFEVPPSVGPGQTPVLIGLAIVVPYLVTFILEVTGLSLFRSVAVALLALAGWLGATYGLVAGLESLTEILRTYSSEIDHD